MLQKVVEWININQGLAMVILTFVYVIATIIIVIFNSKSIRELRITRENEMRPYVFGQFTMFSDYINQADFQIRNSGKTGALIKAISIIPDLPISKDSDGISSLAGFVVAPNQVFNIMLKGLLKDIMDNMYTIHIEYQSLGIKQLYVEDYKIPLNAYSLVGHSYVSQDKHSDEANALRNIASILSSMNKRL